MTQANHYTRGDFLHLAECAGQLASAVLVAMEAGGPDAIDIEAAIRSIPGVHMCHLDAAIIMFVMLVKQSDNGAAEWRDTIPDLVSFIAGQPAA